MAFEHITRIDSEQSPFLNDLTVTLQQHIYFEPLMVFCWNRKLL